MTSHGKTYTNAFPLIDLKKVLAKRWIPVGCPLEVLENPLEVLRKAVEIMCRAVEKPVGKVHAGRSRC